MRSSLAARTRLLLVGLAASLVLAGCGGSGSNAGGDGGDATVGEAATVEATTSTTSPATTTAAPTTTVAPLGLFSPDESAQKLYDAWKADDRATAATLAEPAAVEGQWATAPGDYALYNRCDSGEFGTSGCLFRGNGGTIQYTVERRGDRWVVIQAFFSAP
jgi:hypothetical protein